MHAAVHDAARISRWRPPAVESLALRIVILGFVFLSTKLGFDYWQARDPTLALITLGAEVLAAFGLSVAWFNLTQGHRLWGGVALVLTLAAAGWCATTAYLKIEEDTRKATLAAAQQTPTYVFAQNAADEAVRMLNQRMSEQRPFCTCPETIRAWEATQAASINRLRAERDAAVEKMQAVAPAVTTDWFAVARGVFIEASKLFGFLVFRVGEAPSPLLRPKQPANRHRLRNRLAIAAATMFATTATAAPPASDGHLSADARALAESGMGEARIAEFLSDTLGQSVTRHRVRQLLGRYKSRAA